MLKYLVAAAGCAFAFGLAATPGSAKADVMIGIGGLCMDANTSNYQVVLWQCHGAFNQNFFAGYGQQRVTIGAATLCLEGNGRGNQLRLAVCANTPAQRWGIQANGQFKNETGWCADAEGGRSTQGTRVVMWDCNGALPANQRFVQAQKLPAPSLAGRASGAFAGTTPIRNGQMINPGATLIGTDGATFSVRGGSLVAAGAGNLVAAGAGNLVAAGAGNLIGPGNINGLINPGNMQGLINRPGGN